MGGIAVQDNAPAPHLKYLRETKGGCWERHLKYIGQNCFRYFFSIQQTNRGHETIVA